MQLSTDGFHMKADNLVFGGEDCIIYYNDANCKERIRFTILHEIGHIILDHSEESDLSESEANFFAKYALAPPPLVGMARCEDYLDISKKFYISKEAAFYAMKSYCDWLQYGPRNYLNYEIRIINRFRKIA